MVPEAHNAADRDFLRIASVSTALGLGFMAGAVQCLRADHTGFYFVLSWWTLLAGGIGAAVGLLCWKWMRLGGRFAVVATILLIVAGCGAFLYPLRFVARQGLPDIIKGLVVAGCVISLGAALIWQVRRSLERDNQGG